MSRLFAWFSSGGDSVSINDDDGVNSGDEYSSDDDGEEEEEVYASSKSSEDDDNSSATGQDEIIDHASVHNDDLNDGVDMTKANSDNDADRVEECCTNNNSTDAQSSSPRIADETAEIEVTEDLLSDETQQSTNNYNPDQNEQGNDALPSALPPNTKDNTVDNNNGNDDQDDANKNEEINDSFPKARDFLAETTNDDATILNNHRDDITIDSISRTHKAAEIVEGFDNYDDYNNNENDNNADEKTIATNRTSVSRVQPVSAAFKSASQEVDKKRNAHPHQSIFDILDKNFEELGEGGMKKIGYQDVKLCFIAFVVVFSLPHEPVYAASSSYSDIADTNNNAASSGEVSDNDVDETEDKSQRQKSTNSDDEIIDTQNEIATKTTEKPRPSVPLSVAFALWNNVLQVSHKTGTNFSSDKLSYIRSSLVLLGLLELKSIDRDDDVAPNSSNRSMGYSNRSIECLSVHDEIHQQYGEFLAWGDHDGSRLSYVEEHEQRWNEAVTDASNQIGYNEYTLRMLPLNTMRANHMQDSFDLLKDKTFVRRRMRVLGASEAAKAHVGDVDEILRLIEKRMSRGVNVEPIDEQEALLSAYLQLQKYCLHEAEELTKHYKDEDGNVHLGKAMMPKMADFGDAVHLLGASLGGYGFYDEEMEYYEEALRLKRLSVNGNVAKCISAAETFHCLGFSLDNVGRGDEALECYDQALDIRLACLGDNDLRVADTYHNKGALLCEEDRPDEAMECLEEALRIRELHYGEEHVSCADTMQWMGNLLRKHGDPSDALDYFKFALRIKQATLGSDDIDVANTLFNTAVLLDDLEKFELSLVAYKEALRIRKLVLGDKSQEVADTLFCMGNVATAIEKHSEALGYFNESIELMEALIEKADSPSINEKDDTLLFILNPPSIPIAVKTQYEKLNQAYEEALPLTKLIMGSDHANVCEILTRMGDLYKILHDWDNAIGSFQGAVRAKRADTPDNDGYEVAELLLKKGVSHLYKHEFIRAKATFETALQIWKKISDVDSMPISSSTYCLGVAYYYLGDYSHARLLFEECRRILSKLFGEDCQNVATTLCWLGRQHEKLNDPNTALERYLLALQILKKEKASADYHVVILLLHAIGKMYQHEEVNLLEMSLKCFVQEIGVIHSKLDEDEYSTLRLLADAYFKAGMLYKVMEDIEEAIEHLSKALEYTKQCSDGESHRLATITDALGMLYASKEEYTEAKKYYSSAYSIYEKVSRNHPITSDCVFRLSKVLEILESELTFDFYKESLRVHRINVQEDDARAAEILFCLGRVCLETGRCRDAVKYFEEALTLRKQLSNDSADVAGTYHYLGKTHDQLNEREKALIFFKESVRISKANGDKHALYKASLDMADCAAASSQFSLAVDSYNDCLMATSDSENSNDDADVLQRMGDIEMNGLQKYEDATKHFLDALEICRTRVNNEVDGDVDDQSVNSDDGEKATLLALLYKTAQSYSLSKDYENALEYFEEHIKMIESTSPVNDELLADSLLQMGNIFAEMDDPEYDLAVEKLTECLDIKKEVFGPENDQVAEVNYALGLVYEKARDVSKATTHLAEALRFFKMKRNRAGAANVYHTLARMKASECAESGSLDDRAAAMECYEEALKIRRQVVSLDDTDLASILFEYGSLLFDDGELKRALPLLEEGLRIQKSSKGLKDARVANILLKIAEVHVADGKFDSSLVSLEQVVLIEGSIDDDDDIDLSKCHYLLGVTYIAREEFEKAIDALSEALELKESIFGRKSLECASVHNMLGKAYGKNKMFDKAIESLVKALRIRKLELGNDSLEYGDSVLNLAEIHFAMNNHEKALNCLDEALRVYETQEADTDQLLLALEMKGDCLNETNDYEASALTFQECIDVCHDSPGDHEEEIASFNLKLGKAYATLNDYNNAFGAYRESIRILSEVSGPTDLRVGDVMFEVGVLMCDQGGSDVFDKSMECFTEMIRIYTENGEGTHIAVANALIQKATMLVDHSDYDEAKTAIDDALNIYKDSLADDAVEIGKAMLLYGTLHDTQDKPDEAMAAFSEALDTFKSSATNDDLNIALALSNIGIIHLRKAEYEEAIDKCKQALEIRKMHEDHDHDVADSLFNIGNILDQWGKEDEALESFENSLELYQSLPDNEDHAIANCLLKIGSLCWRRKDIDRCLQSYQESLRYCLNLEEDADSLLASIHKGLAECYYEKEIYDKALQHFVKCLKIQKVELDDDSMEIADTCHRIGLVYQKEEEYEEAIDFHSKALELIEGNCGKETKECAASDLEIGRVLLLSEQYDEALCRLESHLEKYCDDDDLSESIASVHELLGVAHRNLDQCAESIVSLNKALDIRTNLFGDNSLQVANTLVEIGHTMEDMSDDADDAISVYDKAITIFQKTSDVDSRKVAGAYTRLALLLDGKGNHEASLQSLKKALKLYSECNGTDSVEVAETLHRLGKTYDHLGNYEKSAACFTRCIKIFRSVGNEYGAYISQALRSVGKNYARKKQFAKAVELCTESLKMQKELSGEVELVEIAHSLLNIGDIMNQWDKPEQALQFYEEALNSYEEVVGFDSLDVALCKYKIGVVNKGMGESEKALKCFGEALKIHRMKEGDKSLNLATDLFQIAQIYDSYGNKRKALACFEECARIREDVLDEDHLDVLAARRYISTLRKKMKQ